MSSLVCKYQIYIYIYINIYIYLFIYLFIVLTLTPGVSIMKAFYIVKYDRIYFPDKLMINLDKSRNIRLE